MSPAWAPSRPPRPRGLGAACLLSQASRAALICVPTQSIVSKNALQYRGSAQHDAQEFLLWLLDRVHEDLHQAAAQGQGGPPPAKVRARGHPGDGDARGTGTPGEQGRPGPRHSAGGQGRPGDGDARGLRHSPRGRGRPGDGDARGPATRPRSHARTLHLANTVMLAQLRARAEFTGAGVPPCFLPGDTGCRLQGPCCTQCEVPRAHVPSCRPAFRVPSYHCLSRNLLQFR